MQIGGDLLYERREYRDTRKTCKAYTEHLLYHKIYYQVSTNVYD